MVTKSPKSEAILLARAHGLAGLTLSEIAAMHHITMPADLRRHKGWVGTLLETALGASAGSKAEPDFAALGIELKTIPVDSQNQPLETTFVSLAPLTDNTGVLWQTSHVRQKLQKVLWIPVEGERSIPLGQRRVGMPILWQPSAEQEQQLAQDWEELMEMIVLGDYGKINARMGEVLQLRPKGANSRERTRGFDVKGNSIQTLPLGFYLRKIFTQKILQDFLNR